MSLLFTRFRKLTAKLAVFTVAVSVLHDIASSATELKDKINVTSLSNNESVAEQ